MTSQDGRDVQVAKALLTHFLKRDDPNPTHTLKSPLDLTVIRVLLVLAGFMMLNVLVITVHHIVRKVNKSANLYREVDHVISPF